MKYAKDYVVNMVKELHNLDETQPSEDALDQTCVPELLSFMHGDESCMIPSLSLGSRSAQFFLGQKKVPKWGTCVVDELLCTFFCVFLS